MKKYEIITYSFDELSEDAKEKAIQKLWYINVNHDWWEFIFYYAKRIGLKIDGFDIDRGSYCSGNFIQGAYECAKLILKEHGEGCDTFKTAQKFLIDRYNLVAKHSDDYLESEFLKDILEDYRILLSKEYDYLTSEEAILNTIQANEYEFTEDGNLF